MAVEATLGGNSTLFVGEDKQASLELLDAAYNPAIPGSGNPIDMTGMGISLLVSLTDWDAPIITVVGTLTGVFNVLRTMNTQRTIVQLTRADMELFRGKTYRYAWARTDSGSYTIFAYGNFVVQLAVGH